MRKQNNSNNIEKIRHSLAHIMAAAVQEVYPEVKFGIGPAIENGFYYDFDFAYANKDEFKNEFSRISPDDLPKIEEKMRELLNQSIKFTKKEITKAGAKKLFSDQPYKIELINELGDIGDTRCPADSGTSGVPTIYQSGNFIDLCAGPHIKSTSEINPKAFKLTKIAGAYWRGDEKNPMLTRIYGLAFETEKELTDYLKQQEEAEKRDHRKIGRELDLFVFSDLVGPGLPLYTNKGFVVLNEIINYSRKLNDSIGYLEVHTPNMNKADLFKVSGHYEKYKDDMFKVVSNYTKEDYYLKPMNCPQHTQIYAAQNRSYRDLPVRIADFANLYRDERPGELSGLTRLRAFRQDDGHCFCSLEQIKNEFKAVLTVVRKAMKTYKMEYKIRFSLWDPQKPEKYLGGKEEWKKSQKIMEEILVENKIDYFKAVGEAAIYGPKMDLIAKDSIGREWQLSTIQLDLIMPERFGLKYIDKDGKEKTPIMIHRALVGSPERFLGVLIEHYVGAFPVWLSPTQVIVLPIGELHQKYGQEVLDLLKKQNNIRAEINLDNESIGKKIREGEIQKIPYLLIVGDKEIKQKSVAVRSRNKEQGVMKIKRFTEKIKKEIEEKR